MYFTPIAINIYMGIKITELTSASALVGSELTPLIQSTETRQAAVSSVFTALTSQNDGRYVCGITTGTQGCLSFTGAGNGTLNLGVACNSNVTFQGLTANDDSVINGDLVITSSNKLCTRGTFCSVGTAILDGNVQTNGNTVLGDCSTDTLIVNSESVKFCSLPAGTDNSVVILDSNKKLGTDEIDDKVWGGKLVAYNASCVGNNKVPQFVGTDGTVGDSIISATTSNVCMNGTITVLGGCGSTSVLCSNVAIRGSGCKLNVAGDIVGCANLTLACLPTSDPNIAGGVYYLTCDKILRISAAT